jgi:hypothetical protein
VHRPYADTHRCFPASIGQPLLSVPHLEPTARRAHLPALLPAVHRQPDRWHTLSTKQAWAHATQSLFSRCLASSHADPGGSALSCGPPQYRAPPLDHPPMICRCPWHTLVRRGGACTHPHPSPMAPSKPQQQPVVRQPLRGSNATVPFHTCWSALPQPLQTGRGCVHSRLARAIYRPRCHGSAHVPLCASFDTRHLERHAEIPQFHQNPRAHGWLRCLPRTVFGPSIPLDAFHSVPHSRGAVPSVCRLRRTLPWHLRPAMGGGGPSLAIFPQHGLAFSRRPQALASLLIGGDWTHATKQAQTLAFAPFRAALQFVKRCPSALRLPRGAHAPLPRPGGCAHWDQLLKIVIFADALLLLL